MVFCPLEAERRAVCAALHRADLDGATVLLTGIGRDAVAAAVRNLSHRPAIVVLAGICGGLVDVPDVVTTSRVVDEQGGAWDPPIAPGDGVVLVGVDRLISTAAQKRHLHRATGAAVVDMESHGFARACEAWSEGGPLRWAVVRGVSDRFDEAIPEQLVRWIDPRGRMIASHVAADVARRPWLVPSLLRLGKRSRRVLPLVGRRVAGLIREASAVMERG